MLLIMTAAATATPASTVAATATAAATAATATWGIPEKSTKNVAQRR